MQTTRSIDPNAVYTRDEVAEILGIDRQSVRLWKRNKGLPISKGGKGYVIGSQLIEWIAQQAAK